MGIITKEADVTWASVNKLYYVGLGYEFTKIREKFKCKVEHLSRTYKSKLDFECDECGNYFSQSFDNRPSLKDAVLNNEKILCVPCLIKHKANDKKLINDDQIEVIKKLHEEDGKNIGEIATIYNIKPATMQLFFSRNNIKVLSNIDRINEEEVVTLYGEGMGLRELSKLMKTRDENMKNILIKHDVHIRTPKEQTETDYWQENRRAFYIPKDELYDLYITQELSSLEIGVIHNVNHQSVLSLLDKYEIPKRNSNEMFKTERIQNKCRASLSKNGNAPCSNQQRYLQYIFGGELNYPIGISNLDIAFPDIGIYIEYDGRGHDLGVKLGHITEVDFKKREIRRNHYMKDRGWKCMRIISDSDKLPEKEVLLNIFEHAKSWLINQNHSFIDYILDTYEIRTSSGVDKYNYGNLHRLKNKY